MASKNNPMFYNHPADAKLANFTIRDIKREVIVRGMPFEKVVSTSVIDMNSYYRENFYKKTNPELLGEFDKWQESIILSNFKARKKKPEIYATAPELRMGYIREDEEGNETKIRIKNIPEQPKKKKQRLPNGLLVGTKKSYTYELCSNGYSKEDTIKMVKEHFPEAIDKSVGIWYNKAKKYKQNGTNPKLPIRSNQDKGEKVRPEVKVMAKENKEVKKESKLQSILRRARERREMGNS